MRQPLVFLLALPGPQRLIGSLAYGLKIVLIFCGLFVGSASLSAEQNTPLELVFITSEHCPFCKAWERDVGQIYDSTAYGQKARLSRVELTDADSALPTGSADVFGTPTFLIVGNDTEIGRIEGYQSSEMFFWALSEYIKP